MDAPQKEECCKPQECGLCRSHRKCCGGKALMAVVLLLLGGVIGYLMGNPGYYGGYRACPMGVISGAPR